jgi:hypothetical protein
MQLPQDPDVAQHSAPRESAADAWKYFRPPQWFILEGEMAPNEG